jgi:hypothetical protein
MYKPTPATAEKCDARGAGGVGTKMLSDLVAAQRVGVGQHLVAVAAGMGRAWRWRAR